MARVSVPTARASVLDTPEGLVIDLPASKNWALILFIGFWLCGWALGEFSAIHQLATGKTPTSGGSLFLLVWLGAWTVGGCIAISVWLWNVAGHEIVSLTPTSLAIRRSMLGFGPSREYDLPSVKNLRINAPAVISPYNRGFSPQTPFGGTIAFDYGSKTFRFGGGVDEAEASHLVELLKSRYPFDSTP
jgi:hypothetical protein